MASLATTRPSAPRLSKIPLVPTLLVIFAIMAVAAALIYLFGITGPSGTSASEAVYQTAPVRRGSVTSTINAIGQITTPASGGSSTSRTPSASLSRHLEPWSVPSAN